MTRSLIILFCLVVLKSCGISSKKESETQDYSRSITDLIMSSSDFDYLKKIMSEDVLNWPYGNDSIMVARNIGWKMMLVRDTVVPIIIVTDSGNFEIDVVEEFQRRLIGGFAGSYPHVKTWGIAAGKEEVLVAIKKFKTDNPQFQIPGDTSLTNGESSYWHFIDFYDITYNEIVSTWIRGEGEFTTFALYGYKSFPSSKEYGFDNTRLINKDFWKVENDVRIERFQNLIMNPIKLYLVP